MKSRPAPDISRAPAFPLIWIVPLLAIGIGAWLGVRDIWNRGPEITIDFSDASGIEAGKTILEYKGVSVGTVSAVKLKRDLQGVSVALRLNKSAAAFANRGTQFWIDHPEIGLSGVRGLDTLLTGSRLNARPGDGPPMKQFTGLDKPPAAEFANEGRIFVLRSDRLGSLTTGAPVYYRELKVGEVVSSRLADDSAAVLIRIHVEAPYVNLVRTHTRFWNAGGFSFKVSLLGAQLKDTSLESLITGGVAFATPEGADIGNPVPDETQFELASEADKDWLKWSPHIRIESPDNISKSPPLAREIPDLIKP